MQRRSFQMQLTMYELGFVDDAFFSSESFDIVVSKGLSLELFCQFCHSGDGVVDIFFIRRFAKSKSD